MSTAPGALAHVRVLDFTALVQGPMSTQILGDLGADVIKLERPEGEWSRHWGVGDGRTHGELDSFLAFNRNKRSVTVDLKSAEDKARVLDLVRECDVVVENFRPGVMDRLGLGYTDLVEVNPAIIYACSSGWGQQGPYRERPGQDMLAQAVSGMLHMTGRAGDPPTGVGIGVVDLYAGMHLTVATLAALVHRGATGEGQRVEVDLFSCATALQQQELTYYLSHRTLPEKPRVNNPSRFATAPFGIYPTQDGDIVIAMTPCPVLAEAIDLPEIAVFDTNAAMFEHRDTIYEAVAAQLRTASTASWLETLLAHDVWCAEVKDYASLMADEQLAHNELLWDVQVGESGPRFQTVGSPIRMSATPPSASRGVPRLGEHTAEVLNPAPGATAWRPR